MASEFGPLFDTEQTHDASHAAAAAAWMAEHPEAMRLFERLALVAAGRGRRFGMKALAERVRWEFSIERNDDEYKINNNHVAYVGRELVRRHPHLGKLIEFRTAGVKA